MGNNCLGTNKWLPNKSGKVKLYSYCRVHKTPLILTHIGLHQDNFNRNEPHWHIPFSIFNNDNFPQIIDILAASNLIDENEKNYFNLAWENANEIKAVDMRQIFDSKNGTMSLKCYEDQMPQRNLNTALVVELAVVLTPFSLIISFPLWLFAKKMNCFSNLKPQQRSMIRLKTHRRNGLQVRGC